MTKEQIADMLWWFFTTKSFQSKPAWEALAGHLKRLVEDPNPKPINYLNQYEIDEWCEKNGFNNF